MKVEEVFQGARDVLSVKRVFGEPYERNGVTIIPAATFAGGAGGGGGEGPEPGVGGGSGGGFGLAAKPAGAYIIKGDVVSWHPALDINRIVSAASLAFVALLFSLRSIFKSRAKVRRAKIKR